MTDRRQQSKRKRGLAQGRRSGSLMTHVAVERKLAETIRELRHALTQIMVETTDPVARRTAQLADRLADEDLRNLPSDVRRWTW